MLFPTTLVGSYPQPEWLIDRKKLAGRFPPRVRAKELWRIPDALLAEAQEDATLLAIRAQEEAGLDIITDGEIRRESYSNRFATALEGVDTDNPGTALDRSGHPNPALTACRPKGLTCRRDRTRPAGTALRPSTAHSKALPEPRRCTSASATPPSSTCGPPATRSSANLRAATAARFQSRRRSPISTV